MTKISIKEASEMMGVSPALLRLIIQQEKIPTDIAFCLKRKGRFYYYINRNKFINFLKDSK